MFLANNPQLNTATDIVKSHRMTKSLVSTSVRTLQERGLVAGEFKNGNHRSIHLNVCNVANQIIKKAEEVQKKYLNIVSDGFSEEKMKMFRSYFKKVLNNIKTYYFETI